MKTKYLLQSLKFAFLPTICVLILLFFGFFDISETIKFISSNNGFAIMLRVALIVAEITLVYIMYGHYEKKDLRHKAINDPEKSTGETLYYDTSIYRLDSDWSSNDKYVKYRTQDDDVIIIERLKNKTK
jgi:hypothetical protein